MGAGSTAMNISNKASRSQEAIMSRADEFRHSTEEFWSEMDQKRKVFAAGRKPTPTSSRNTPKKLSVGRTNPKTKKSNKH
jgi:hypothetical protein